MDIPAPSSSSTTSPTKPKPILLRAAAAAALLPLAAFGSPSIGVAAAAAVDGAAQQQQQRTAVVFGATGAVGSEIVRALLLSSARTGGNGEDEDSRLPFWKDIVLVGRREATDLPEVPAGGPRVKQAIVPDLTKHDRIVEAVRTAVGSGGDVFRADACFVAVGSGNPHLQAMREWHEVDVTIVASAAKACASLGAKHVALLSAIDATDPDQAAPFSEKELEDPATLGYWRMIGKYFRVKGLSERAAIDSGVESVRIAQPSQIVTDQYRYGWLDRTLFFVLPFLDPLMPKRWHSVRVRDLGAAMVGDAEEVLGVPCDDSSEKDDGVTRLTYGDFVRVLRKKEEGARDAVKGKEEL